MKIRMLLGGAVLGAAAALVASNAMSQDHAKDHATHDHSAGGMQEMSPEAMQEMMEGYMKLSQPGEHHAMLAKAVGTWDVETKMWMDPSMPPEISRGTSTIESVLDGRFIMEKMSSTMNMMGQELPFQGISTIGYDNVRQIFVGTWMDSMGTQILTMKGTMPPGSNVLTMYGEMDEPMMGMYGRLVKYVTTHVDADHTRFEMYDLAVGDDYKVMEINYTRRRR